MLRLALRNLLVRKARTGLSLIGLTVAILGIIALISVSRGVQALLRDTLSHIPGLIVLQRDVPSLGFSTVSLGLGADLERLDGVAWAAPQVWYPAFEVEGQNLILKGDPFNMYAVLGGDVRRAAPIDELDGRWLDPAKAEVVIPRLAAERFHKKIGDRLHLVGRDVEVVGVFRSGSFVFDRCILTPLGLAREIAGKEAGFASSFYVEPAEGTDLAVLAKRIEERFPETHAWTTEEVNKETGQLWAAVDAALLAIASIAVFVGAVGIVNTMLMSVLERTGELGVLRATGWTRRDVMRLIVAESAALGVIGGFLGCGVGAALVAVAGALLPVKPVVTPGLLALSMALAVLLGGLGGLYPAWRAARLDPIEAIRT
jgi:putative ABC transport system permease protein